jgi:hypothetical protein
VNAAPDACADASLAAAESLAGTATQVSRWLLVEVRGAWGRDPVDDTDLPTGVRERLSGFEGRIVFIRRPERRTGATVIQVRVDEDGGAMSRIELETLNDIAGRELDFGGSAPIEGPLLLVCAHGRRDACCARLGRPTYDALVPHLAAGSLWQSSHLGGHRFAPNIVVLPAGLQLGRVPLDRAGEVVSAARAERIPLDLYRGRMIYPPHVQAAEIHVRQSAGLDRIADVRLVSDAGDRVTFATPSGDHTVHVEQRPGPATPASCGSDPEPTVLWETSSDAGA